MTAGEAYAALGLTTGQHDEAAVRKAYYRLAQQFHPDKNPEGRVSICFISPNLIILLLDYRLGNFLIKVLLEVIIPVNFVDVTRIDIEIRNNKLSLELKTGYLPSF